MIYPVWSLCQTSSSSLLCHNLWHIMHFGGTEPKLSEVDLFNEACALRLAAQFGQRNRCRRELDQLIKVTDFTRSELKLLYWGWKCSCPSGTLSESNFKEIYAQFFPQAGQLPQVLCNTSSHFSWLLLIKLLWLTLQAIPVSTLITFIEPCLVKRLEMWHSLTTPLLYLDWLEDQPETNYYGHSRFVLSGK